MQSARRHKLAIFWVLVQMFSTFAPFFYILPIPSVFSSFGFPCYCRLGPTMAPPPTKNPLQIVDLQGINFLYPYPGPGFPRLPYQNKGSVIHCHSTSYLHLFLPCFLYFDLNLSFLATLWRPENHTKNLLQKPTPSLRFYLFLFNSAKLKLFPFNNKKISLFSSFV